MVSTVLSRLKQQIRSIGRQTTNVVVPATCLTCDRLVEKQGGCCARCWSELRFVREPYCPVMGTPFSVDLGEGFLSAEAIADPPSFGRLRTVMLYDDLARRMASSIKFSDRLDLVPAIAGWMAAAGKELLKDADMIIPVPLHISRLRTRRFNQSAELARHISSSCGVDHEPELLVRRKATRQQVGLTEKQRARNVSGAFQVKENCRIRINGKRILLIDDVYTTGATVKAATRALMRAGAAQVDVLVFAKVETFEL